MNSFTQMVWKKVVSYIGSAEALVRPVAKQIKILVDSEDIKGLRTVAFEGLEAVEAERAMWQGIIDDTDDGTLDLAETASVVVLVEKMLDEREDQFTGHDEDDPVPPTTEDATESGAD